VVRREHEADPVSQAAATFSAARDLRASAPAHRAAGTDDAPVAVLGHARPGSRDTNIAAVEMLKCCIRRRRSDDVDQMPMVGHRDLGGDSRMMRAGGRVSPSPS